MRGGAKLFALAAWLLIAAGCASRGEPIDPRNETLSLVYGYFDMKDAPSDLLWVSIKKDSVKPQYYAAGVKGGLFWHVGIEPGAYQVETFGGQGGIPLLTRPFRYNFGTRNKNDSAINIQKPGLYFMGAYTFVEYHGGFLEADKFAMKPTKIPSEREILGLLLKELESDNGLKIYTRQITLVKNRLTEISR